MKILAVLLATLCLGCTSINNWMDSHPASNLTVPAAQMTTNKSPWTPTIQENYQLTDCQETARRMQIAMKIHDQLVVTMHDKVKDDGLKQVLMVEIRSLYEYVDELHTWMSDNCEEA